MVISIIVPAYNEAEGITSFLQHLQPLRQRGHQVILVDGGSTDATVDLATPWVDTLLISEPSRALQMNRGAEKAMGDWLLFLHADSRLPGQADELIASAERQGHLWGRFDVKLSGCSRKLRLIEWAMNQRSRLTGIATGDQAVFVKSELFKALGGYGDMPIMEDVELSKRLKRQSSPLCIATPVVTSSRRWERNGVMRTIFLMWTLRFAYFVGVAPSRLHKYYYGEHACFRPGAGQPSL